MRAEEIRDRYAELEQRYGSAAPVALLAWCGLAVNTQDAQVQALVPYLKETIVKRELAIFRAKRDGDEGAITDAYIECAAHFVGALGTAVAIEIMAPQDDEG